MTADKRDLEHYKEIDRGIKDAEEAENQENPRTLLENIFHRADTNEDRLLDIQELAKWIHTKITEHVSRAMKENVGLFTAIDNNPRNGELRSIYSRLIAPLALERTWSLVMVRNQLVSAIGRGV